jgi:hypothetical protein
LKAIHHPPLVRKRHRQKKGKLPMPNRSEHRNCIEKLLTPTATSTGTVTSASLDTKGFDSAHFNLAYGATAPTPTSVTVEESDDDSTFAAAPATSVVDDSGTHAVSKTSRIAYVGNKRYARVVVVQSASTILTITGHMGYAEQKPTANPA